MLEHSWKPGSTNQYSSVSIVVDIKYLNIGACTTNGQRHISWQMFILAQNAQKTLRAMQDLTCKTL